LFVGEEVLSPETGEISLRRKAVAGAAMLGAAGMMAWQAFQPYRIEWVPIGFAGILAASAVGITRRSLAAQILSRGAAWITLFPTAIMVLFQLLRGHLPGLDVSAFAGTTAVALLAASPMLRTKEALAAFAPKAYRRILLAGSTATVATAYLTGGIALESFSASKLMFAPFVVLTLSLLASALAVVRMRAWGVLLGAATSIILLVSALFVGHGWGSLLAFCAAPMLALHVLPILLARQGFGTGSRSPSAATSTTRVSALDEEPRYRVALYNEEADEEPAFTAVPAVLRSP